MIPPLFRSCARLFLVTLSFSAPCAAQQFVDISASALPGLGLNTEAVKFGDLDQDGDLDLIYANGGDAGSQLSKILINNGLAQGGVIGTFTDATNTAIPGLFSQSSRDVQTVDVDRDGDLDLYFSNHSQNGNQSNTWFINQGGAQGGTAGVFIVDQSRWLNIGGAGSSIPAAQKINSGSFAGGFVDWSCQCDFADVDLDGDWDLLHTSYGSAFTGSVMSRLFLNTTSSGQGGFFSEYNPSGAVSGNPNLANGSQAGFAEGTQSNNTTNFNGGTHDITNIALDADFADFDGDFDADIQASSRDTQNRMYQNRFFENGGSTGSGSARLYRDITASWVTGTGGLPQSGQNYDSDPHDLDNDNDTDVYFVNYTGGFTDRYGFNDGTGKLVNWQVASNSSNDDNEVDWHDFDNDGDVDPIVSSFSVSDRFYQNQLVETGFVDLVEVSPAGATGSNSLGTDVGDINNDGDLDLIFGQDSGVNEVLLENTLNQADPIAPRVVNISQIPSGAASSTPRRVMAVAFDNVNLEYFKTATATLHFTTNGNTGSVPAQYAGGNLFRAMLPGYWFGNISYTVSVKDRAGNTGTSAPKNVNITNSGFSTFGAPLPGCHGAYSLGLNSATTINNPELELTCTGAPPSTLQLCIVTDVAGTGADELGIGIPIWAGIAGSTELIALDAFADGAGFARAPASVPNVPALVGRQYFFQFIFGDFSCATVLSASGGATLTILP